MKNKRKLLGLSGILLAGIAVYSFFGEEEQKLQVQGTAIVEIVMPELSESQLTGQETFEQYCAACHGINAVGQVGVAPPLIHKIYEPSHHPDGAFYAAAEIGVRQHHWPFGPMPKVEGITKSEVTSIIEFIRKVQRANGIN